MKFFFISSSSVQDETVNQQFLTNYFKLKIDFVANFYPSSSNYTEKPNTYSVWWSLQASFPTYISIAKI